MIVGDSRTEATGPFAVALRLAATAVCSRGIGGCCRGQLRMHG